MSRESAAGFAGRRLAHTTLTGSADRGVLAINPAQNKNLLFEFTE